MGSHIRCAPAAGQPHSPSQELDPVSRPLGDLHVPQRELGDALHGHILGVNLMTEGQIRQNAGLASGVDALDIGGGIRLCVALGLSFPQGVGEKGAGADHAGEDIVGGAVEDAVYLFDAVGSQALPQGVQDGDAAAHAGLEKVVDVLLSGQGQKLAAVLRHQLLVGRHHVLAGLQSPLGILIGGFHAADGLHHHTDVLILLDPGKVIRHQLAVGAVLEAAHQNGFHLQRFAQLALNLPGILRHHPGNAGSHGAQAQNGDLYHLFLLSVLIPPGPRISPRPPGPRRRRAAVPDSPPSRRSPRRWSPPRSRWWEWIG